MMLRIMKRRNISILVTNHSVRILKRIILRIRILYAFKNAFYYTSTSTSIFALYSSLYTHTEVRVAKLLRYESFYDIIVFSKSFKYLSFKHCNKNLYTFSTKSSKDYKSNIAFYNVLKYTKNYFGAKSPTGGC